MQDFGFGTKNEFKVSHYIDKPKIFLKKFTVDIFLH